MDGRITPPAWSSKMCMRAVQRLSLSAGFVAEKKKVNLSRAMVKFRKTQYGENGGGGNRFYKGIWGIFGHGNVSGLGQALVEYGDDLPYHQPTNEQ